MHGKKFIVTVNSFSGQFPGQPW